MPQVELHRDLIDTLLTALDWYADDREYAARYGDEEEKDIWERVEPQIDAAREVLQGAWRSDSPASNSAY